MKRPFTPIALLGLILTTATAMVAAGASGSAVGSALAKHPIAAWQIPSANQVRIEQHFSIRITPGISNYAQQMQMDFDSEEAPTRYTEHKMGKCLPIAAIASVQGGNDNQLVLQLHDTGLIRAKLEKTCLARDFYAGFYLDRNADGQLCVGRDQLRSRNGVSCKIKQLHELRPASSYRLR
jgi:hypothetical protein